jgi:hypothetical protein
MLPGAGTNFEDMALLRKHLLQHAENRFPVAFAGV